MAYTVAMIAREQTADRITDILNHPEVRRWVAGPSHGRIDAKQLIADPRHHVLLGQHGGAILISTQAGIYECVPTILPSADTDWITRLAEAVCSYAFITTEAFEITATIPKDHAVGRAMVATMGLAPELSIETAEEGAAGVFSTRIQDWAKKTRTFDERGQRFRKSMYDEAHRLGIEKSSLHEDPDADRHIGIAIGMALAGRQQKGVNFYNRFVSMTRRSYNGKIQLATLVSEAPLIVRFGTMLVKIDADDIELIRPN